MTSNYKSFWNEKASNPLSAYIAVDGSADEAILQQTGAAAARRVLAALQPDASAHIFEIGCGVGRIGKQLLPHVAHWHGMDISENMLTVAATRLADQANVGFSALLKSELPLESDSQDAGYCIAVFFHMDKEDFVLYLREVARVLKPGGVFYFDHWNVGHPVGFKRFLMEVRDQSSFAGGARRDVARNQFSCLEEIQVFVQHAGLQLLWVDQAHFIQCIVRKPGADEDSSLLPQHQHAVKKRHEQIAYPKFWIDCFEAMVDDALDTGVPKRSLAVLRRVDDDQGSVHLHRIWLRGIWLQNQSAWGALPDWLE